MSNRSEAVTAVLEQLEPRMLLSTTILSEGFEGTFPGGWSVNVSQDRMWDDTSGMSHNGSWSGHCAETSSGSPTGNYVNNMTTVLETAVDLTGFVDAELSFWYWMNTEADADYFSVEINGNRLRHFSGDHQNWRFETVYLEAYAGLSDVTITFQFDSDSANIPAGQSGVWLDDILVIGEVDEDDQISEAMTVPVGSEVEGRIRTSTDVDFYRVNVSASQSVSVDVNLPSYEKNFSARLGLYDSSGTKLAIGSYDLSGEPQLCHVFGTAGDYYIGVSAGANKNYDPVTGEGDVDGGSTGYYTLLVHHGAWIGDNPADLVAANTPRSIVLTDDGGTPGEAGDDSSLTVSFRGGAAKVSFAGANVSQTMSGRNLLVTGSGVFCSRIEAYAQGAKGKLDFRTRGADGTAAIGDIFVRGTINSISGKTVDLMRHLLVGGARKIQLHDVAGSDDQIVQIGKMPDDLDAPLDPRSAISLTFGHIEDLELLCYVPVKSLTLMDWTDTGGDRGHLEAPSVAKLMTRGQKGNAKRGLAAINGDFLADMHLWDSDAPRSTLGSARIAGNLGAEGMGVWWRVDGNGGRLDIRGVAYDSTVRCAGSIASAKLGAAVGSNFYAGVMYAFPHPWAPDDFTDTSATIGSVRIMGIGLPRGIPMPRCFVDSNFSAACVRSVQLLNVDGDNWGTPFGLWTLEEGRSVRIRETEEGWVGAPTPDLHIGVVT